MDKCDFCDRAAIARTLEGAVCYVHSWGKDCTEAEAHARFYAACLDILRKVR